MILFAGVVQSPLRCTKNRGWHHLENFGNVGNSTQSRALGASFQLADVAFGVAEGVGQILLAPAPLDAQLGQFCAEGLT